MKQFKTLVALVLAMMLMTSTALAATITIKRDSTWDENAEEAKATYTYYKIFDAQDITQTVTEATGAQANTDGVAVYTISGTDAADKVAALPSGMFNANLAADGKYYITLANASTSAADIAAALKTMVDANTALFPGTSVTSSANPVVLPETGTLTNGYYLIEASNGSVLAVQTLDDVTIIEKNDYPKVDKKQSETTASYKDEAVTVQVGDYINYQVTVTIPNDVNQAIIVGDKMSAGLEYDATTGLAYSTDISASVTAVTSTDVGYDADATWQIKIPADTAIANKGTDIVITYRAKVTAAALTDTGKENEVTLTYDNGNYVLTDTVNYETYFAGIYKVDPKDTTADMSGVKFNLTDGDDAAVNVTYDNTNGYYVVDPTSTSNEVETRKDGDYYTIKIRGLDGDKTYKLTETVTKAGYNLLEGTVTLSKTKDEGTAFADKAANTFDKVENNKGTVLPSTGGIGTTIFYIAGAVLVLGAAAIVIARRKADQH